DSVGMPAPLPQYAQVCNVTWIHTDYSKENGSVAIVPGSHRFGRHPFPHEEDFLKEDAPFRPIAIEAAAGSIVFWHGNTWHGAWPRTEPGVRINTLMYFNRSYVKQMQDLRLKVTDEMLERNPPEFAELVGCKHPYPLANDQLNPGEQVEWFRRSGRSQWS
ncbi:MAG TPA: phytanoyl-CoA dioxygenase family protein, partial [Nitriliruptorales bacterium]